MCQITGTLRNTIEHKTTQCVHVHSAFCFFAAPQHLFLILLYFTVFSGRILLAVLSCFLTSPIAPYVFNLPFLCTKATINFVCEWSTARQVSVVPYEFHILQRKYKPARFETGEGAPFF